MNKKVVIGSIIALVLVVVGVLGWQNQMEKQANEHEFKVGVILPLSGAISELGHNALVALEIAEDEINKKTTDINRTRIKLIVEDGKYTSKDSISAYQKLKLENVQALIVLGDVPNYSLAPLIDKDGIPCIAYVATAQNIPDLSPWMFRGWYSTDAASKEMVNYLKKDDKMKLSILSILNNFGDEFSKSLEKEFVPVGGVIASIETFDMESLDNRPQVQKILTKLPDAIAVIGFGPSYIAAFNQIQENKFDGVLLTETTVAQDYYKSNIKNEHKNIYYVDTSVDIFENADSHFVKTFRAQTKKEPDIFSAFGYINLNILDAIINKHGVSAKDIQSGLLKMKNYQSLVGAISFLPNGELSVKLKMKKLDN